MGINFGDPNTTRWYAGDIADKPNISGDFTALVVSTHTTVIVSKHQYFLSMKGAGAVGSLNLLSPNTSPLGLVRTHTQTSGSTFQTTVPMVNQHNHILISRRRNGVMQTGFLDLTTRQFVFNTPAANTDVITPGNVIVGELSGSPGTRGVLYGLSVAGVWTKYFEDQDLLDLADGRTVWDDHKDAVWEVFKFPSATPTITGEGGTVLTRNGTGWGDSYDPIPLTVNSGLDQLPPVVSQKEYKSVSDRTRFYQNIYQGSRASQGYSKWTPAVAMPPALPPATAPGSLIDAYNITSAKLYALWDTLLPGNEDYVTKTLLGKDESGTKDIFLFDFKPESYTTTLIVACGMHGSESYPSYLMYLFFNEVINRTRTSVHLEHIRNNVRVLVVPVLNPYGCDASTRGNVNLVDINRNWDYRWDEYVVQDPNHDAKGSAPWSEAETRIMRDVILAHPESKAFIDMHFLGVNVANKNFVNYSASEFDTEGGFVQRVIRALRTSDAQNAENLLAFNPSGYIWVHKELGMFGCNPEWSSGRFGSSTFTSEDVTWGVKWFGNVLLSFSYP